MTATLTTPVENWIDLDRFPVTDLAAPAGQQLVEDCHTRFAKSGVCLLEGFVRRHAVDVMRAEADALTDKTHYYESAHNPYLESDDPSYPPDHPRRRVQETNVGAIAYDLIPADTALKRLYLWEPLRDFIRCVLGKDRLYRFADPLGACSINVFGAGGKHGWHFDEAEFTVTMMLQPAETGGDFEYVPNTRSSGNENYELVARVLDGDRTNVRFLPFEPGSLLIFGGRNTLHRLSDIGGERLRLVPVLCFADEPDATNSDEVRLMFWGRTGREGIDQPSGA